ncbi:unnamed protein product [Cyclocybe aegerita]|uniref:Uncharacterized protein n=1 Tax=Cyclocybe aegerita TaxID=1973307 RepID=A0A8S0VTM5_CYCAE|nr:unnamed protein product [Cyclocybe aegerita]
MNLNIPQTGQKPVDRGPKWAKAGFSGDFKLTPQLGEGDVDPTHWAVEFQEYPGPYDAFPAGKKFCKFYSILNKYGLSYSDDFNKRGVRFSTHQEGVYLIYQIIFRDAAEANVHICYGYKDPDGPGERLPVVTIGLPDRPATAEQKQKVAALMGLEVEQLIQVYIAAP